MNMSNEMEAYKPVTRYRFPSGAVREYGQDDLDRAMIKTKINRRHKAGVVWRRILVVFCDLVSKPKLSPGIDERTTEMGQ